MKSLRVRHANVDPDVLAKKVPKAAVRSPSVSVLEIDLLVIVHPDNILAIGLAATTVLVVIGRRVTAHKEIAQPVIANQVLRVMANVRSAVALHAAAVKIVVATNHHNRGSSSAPQPSRRLKSL